ncbi:hypothetical protein [Sphingobium subterraneum]|uniref:Uncharacterized protein n=1 Tax=Sphingobium subterraneum TaxID=627688 RepID=A0A841JA01_9SPHN|nr:hypothetical protein [Sphingobium subterraneum]MBB6125398.1 hypothetical protein [Sphingobium subterraneum]
MTTNASIFLPPKSLWQGFQKTIWQRNYGAEWQHEIAEILRVFERKPGKHRRKERLQDKGSASGALLIACLHILFSGGTCAMTGGKCCGHSYAVQSGRKP